MHGFPLKKSYIITERIGEHDFAGITDVTVVWQLLTRMVC